MPVHGIDESLGALRIELAADGLSGTVYADGHAKPREMGNDVCTTPANPYADQPVLTLDLTGITPVTAGGVKRWIHVPAKIAAGHELIGGGTYPAGSNWGSFTIAVPEPMRRTAATALAFAALAGPAHAAETSGSLTLTVTAKADRALDARGVSVRTTGKATRSGRKITLPLSAGDAKALRTAGSLRLRAKRRSVRSAPRGSSSAPTRASRRCSAGAARRC